MTAMPRENNQPQQGDGSVMGCGVEGEGTQEPPHLVNHNQNRCTRRGSTREDAVNVFGRRFVPAPRQSVTANKR